MTRVRLPARQVQRARQPSASLFDSPAFADIDRHFARFLERLVGGANPLLALAAALVSRSRGQGNICLDLRTVAGTLFPDDVAAQDPRWPLPEADPWLAALRTTPVVGWPGEFKPLILDGAGRLYLRRYWEYESELAKAIRQRASLEAEGIDADLLEKSLERFFPATALPGGRDWQRLAVRTAMRKRFCVISGGPGTGKTRTAAVFLALLLEQAGGKPLRMALAAPTGKAAARLQESIQKLKTSLPCDEQIRTRLPEEAFTLHRLLGGNPDSIYFRYHAENPLPFDVILVDEASMVDLALMARLFAASPTAARVVLLGDKDQLASVEAGAVLGDICQAGAPDCRRQEPGRASDQSGSDATPARPGRGSDGASAGPLTDCIVQLRRNYRFGADNGILALSHAVNDGDVARTVQLLQKSSRPPEGVEGFALPTASRIKEDLREPVLAGFGPVLRAGAPLLALQALNRFRILCALRQGPYGVEALNQLAEEILAEAGLISPRARWYAGRPVMVTRNDYNLKLFNGDVGIILPETASGEPRAWFVGADNSLRSVPPVRLPAHETVFAMTVHKSQGSEFERVLLLLPDRESPVLTRELLYTGVTRASRRVEVWFDEAILRQAVARKVARTSGLSEALSAGGQ